MKNLRVATVQFQHSNGDKEANLAVITRFVEQAARQGVKLITFPECCITGYWFLRKLTQGELLTLAEPIPAGPSSQSLLRLARQYDMTIGAGMIELAEDGSLYNAYVVAMPNGRFACHRKIHCFINEHMKSGDAFTVFDTPHGCRVGVLTCYDNNLGENVRIVALQRAEILLAPHQTGGCKTGSPFSMGRIDRRLWDNRGADPAAIEAELAGPKGRQWLVTWLPARAFDNGIFVLFSNGVGPDDDEVRTGNAMILDPYGRIITETGKADDVMLVADLEGALYDHAPGRRRLKVRRPELYTPLVTPTGREEDIRNVRFEGIEQK
ncbi:MAG: nitrilase family protein [Sedimentisphaerales bacterium]|nr:nitrilase family protein [Sedimentisphaerales bacterium]